MRKEFQIVDPYENKLTTYLWETKKDVKGVVQIIHGASEHMGRYENFALYLNDQGFHVIGNDHLGHGKTSNDSKKIHFANSIGFHKVYEGVKTVRDYIDEEYPGLPVIMFAHSMGSFIGRYTIIHDYKRYHQAIFSGTGYFSAISIKLGSLLAGIISKIKGNEYVSEFYNNRVMNGHIRNMRKNGIINHRDEWLTQDRDIVKAFQEDELCGKPFTIGAQRDILKMIPEIQNKALIKASASSTPLFFISGDLDGLGGYGADAKKLYKIYRDCGYSNVKFSIINNSRHEIINEVNKDEHYRIISDWIEHYL